MSSLRTPCINPRCRRTAAAEKFGEGVEIICGKCFRTLPDVLRNEHRRIWREMRKWDRRATRTVDELKRQQMHAISRKWGKRIHENWERIRQHIGGERPEGLDNFLKEAGLNG